MPCVGLKFGVAGGAGERDDVADVLDAAEEHEESLEAESESRMLDGAEFP